VLRWRYGSQLQWRLVTIGLTERADQYVKRGYTPAKSARGYLKFRRYGMPFATEPRPRVAGTGTACRAIVATRLRDPQREDAVFRALQFGWFTTPLVLDEAADLEIALRRVEGLDVRAILAALHDPEVESAYEADRAEARTAEGGPTHFQGKAASTDGPVRFTAPSIVFESNGSRLEAGGFQPVEAYDVLIANLDPTLQRAAPPEDLVELLAAFPEGLVTQEVAAILAPGNEPPDRRAAEEALIDLVASGDASRIALGDDALWMPGRAARRLVRVA
jgi:2-hydroxychromene-2-carboxylate isomerase